MAFSGAKSERSLIVSVSHLRFKFDDLSHDSLGVIDDFSDAGVDGGLFYVSWCGQINVICSCLTFLRH